MIRQFNRLFPMKKANALQVTPLKHNLVNLVLATLIFKPAYRSAKLVANSQVGRVC